MNPQNAEDFLVSPSFRASDWQRLTFDNEEDWNTAIQIVKERILKRFVCWIDLLIVEQFSGFATLALDCLLLETLSGFQSGVTTRNTQEIYVSFLTRPAFGFDIDLAKRFQKQVRNKLLHNTQTFGRWLIKKDKPDGKLFMTGASGNVIMNRTMFHNVIKNEFDAWVSELQAGNKDLREKMKCRMQAIVDEHWSCGDT